MTLPTLKLHHINPPKMGWPLKIRSRTRKNWKNLKFLKISCNLPSWCTVIWGFDILYYFLLLCLAISYPINYLLRLSMKGTTWFIPLFNGWMNWSMINEMCVQQQLYGVFLHNIPWSWLIFPKFNVLYFLPLVRSL